MIQKFCYHSDVTSQFCPTYFTLNQVKLEKTANISRQDWFPCEMRNDWRRSLRGTIVSRGDWLGNPGNIKVENNGAVGYIGSSLTEHNPLFSVHKLGLDKLTQCSIVQ